LFLGLNSLDLVRAILKDAAPLEELTDLEEEVLVEVGNMLPNSCFSTFADVLHQEIRTELPSYVGGDVDDIFRNIHRTDVPEESVLLGRIEFNVTDKDIRGHVVPMLETDALNIMLEQVEKHMLGI